MVNKRTKQMKNNEILGILNILKQIDIKKVNILTSYWISRNVRIMEPVLVSFEVLRKSVISDPWFIEYQAEAKDHPETAQEKFKEQLKEADEELKSFLDTETETKIYKISIDNLDIPSESIPALLDFITDSQQ